MATLRICRTLHVMWCVNPRCQTVGESMFAIVVENVCFDNNLNAAINLPLPENLISLLFLCLI